MGVYIPKMEMPTSCNECHFGQGYECVDEIGYGCLLTLKTRPKGETGRPNYCPLVEVPKHGDLIDRDETFEAIDNLMGYGLGIDAALDYILIAGAVVKKEES